MQSAAWVSSQTFMSIRSYNVRLLCSRHWTKLRYVSSCSYSFQICNLLLLIICCMSFLSESEGFILNCIPKSIFICFYIDFNEMIVTLMHFMRKIDQNALLTHGWTQRHALGAQVTLFLSLQILCA